MDSSPYNASVQSLVFTLTSVGPVFLIIGLGILLRKIDLVDQTMAGKLSSLVYHIFLPALLIRVPMTADFPALLLPGILIAAWSTLLFSFALAWIAASLVGADRETRGIFASGATWSNVAIVGYALGEALYGDQGLARAAIISALLLPMHSVLGISSMDVRSRDKSGEQRVVAVLKRLLRNPIILAILTGVGLSFLPWTMPGMVMNLLETLGRASLPLALVSIGASLNFTRNNAGFSEALGATAVKLLLMPIVGFLLARWLGLDPHWTGSITIAFSCPTAVSFFVVSRNLGYHASRGAAIVTATTLGSVLTTGIIALLLKHFGLA